MEMPFDVPLDAPRGAPHVHGERGDRDGCGNGQQPFPQCLVGSPLEEIGGTDAQQDGDGNAHVHRRDQIAPPALAEIRQADGDNQECFEPLAEGDYKRLEHVWDPETRLNLKMSDQSTR
jgi:hypothetical protein